VDCLNSPPGRTMSQNAGDTSSPPHHPPITSPQHPGLPSHPCPGPLVLSIVCSPSKKERTTVSNESELPIVPIVHPGVKT
jgi:hypothetical protein